MKNHLLSYVLIEISATLYFSGEGAVKNSLKLVRWLRKSSSVTSMKIHPGKRGFFCNFIPDVFVRETLTETYHQGRTHGTCESGVENRDLRANFDIPLPTYIRGPWKLEFTGEEVAFFWNCWSCIEVCISNENVKRGSRCLISLYQKTWQNKKEARERAEQYSSFKSQVKTNS